MQTVLLDWMAFAQGAIGKEGAGRSVYLPVAAALCLWIILQSLHIPATLATSAHNEPARLSADA